MDDEIRSLEELQSLVDSHLEAKASLQKKADQQRALAEKKLKQLTHDFHNSITDLLLKLGNVLRKKDLKVRSQITKTGRRFTLYEGDQLIVWVEITVFDEHGKPQTPVFSTSDDTSVFSEIGMPLVSTCEISLKDLESTLVRMFASKYTKK